MAYNPNKFTNYLNSQMNQKILITMVCLVSLGSAKLEVSNFAQMDASMFDQSLTDIPYSIANFGFAPFGKTMIAQLHQTPGLDPECGYNSSAAVSKSIENSFLLIPRGECPFVTKAIHAQEIGAKLAIIMDNEEHDRKIIMKDNGYGYKVNIPSIFINHEMGKKLMDLINATQDKVILKISFENIKTDKAEVVIYTQSMNRLSYHFIEQFQPFYNRISNYIDLSLVYDVLNCTRCSADDCYNKGQYCSISYLHGNSANGRLVLDQQIREQVMFLKHRQQWWPYLKCISDECNKISEIKECSAACLSRQGGIKPEQLDQEVAQTFQIDEENSVLKESLYKLKNAGVQSYPSVSINGVRIRGSLNAEFVFDDICNSLLSPPNECSRYITEEVSHISTDKTNWLAVVLVLLGSAAFFTALFIFCRRRMLRRMTQDMQERVDDMVSKYVQFYSERNKR